MEAKRFGSVGHVLRPLGAADYFVHDRFSGRRAIVKEDMAAVIQSLHGFQTLREHVSTLIASSRLSDLGEVRLLHLLQAAEQQGLIAEEAQVQQHLNRHQTNVGRTPIEVVAIVTRERPQALERAVRSIGANALRHGRTDSVLVIDDSRHVESQSRNLKLLEALAHQYSLAVRYANRQHRRNYITRLSERSGLEKDLLDFGLLGSHNETQTIGACRNCVLLETAGRVALWIDDDVQTTCLSHPSRQEGLLVGGLRDPTDFWFYSDRESMLSSVYPTPEDALAMHENVLGRTLADLVGSDVKNVSFTYPCHKFWKRCDRPPGKVILSQPGIAGDSALPSSAGLLFTLRDETWARLVESEQAFRSAMKSREVVRVAPTLTICHGSPVATTALAVDNRQELPPFMPVMRGEDTLFGIFLQLCGDDSYSVSQPAIYPHFPLNTRFYSMEDFRESASTTLFKILRRLTALFSSHRPESGSRYERLGRFLSEIGRMDRYLFDEMLCDLAVDEHSDLLLRLRRLKKVRNDKPLYWARAIDVLCEEHMRSLVSADIGVPIDLQRETLEKSTQHIVLQFGQLIEKWNRIRDAARTMTGGDCLSIQVGGS